MIKRVTKSYTKEEVLSWFDPIIQQWFNSKFTKLAPPQAYAIPLIHQRKNVLVASPTGSGKTLTAFLTIINELFELGKRGALENKVYCVYISPLKALANDIERNLQAPLREIYKLAEAQGIQLPEIRVGVRSGDTTPYEKQKMVERAPHILITTPETLAIVLSTKRFKDKLRDVQCVIVDEIHEVSSSKRGVFLSLSIERLQHQVGRREFIRIGLSATQAPIEEIAKFLVGYRGTELRDVYIVEVEPVKQMELRVMTPVPDLNMVPFEIANSKMYDMLKQMINSHRTTLIFTNTRSGTEHVIYKLQERGIENIAAHHGSLSKTTRLNVEQRLKNGELSATVCSTSLELGIDIGYIDLVCQIGSPKSIAKGIQRVGRAGHALHDISRGRFIVFDRDDLVECTVLVKSAYDGKIDRVNILRNSLDVLAQSLVGMSLEQRWHVADAYALVKNSYCYHTLRMDDFLRVLRYIGGKYTLEERGVYGKVWFDPEDEMFGIKRGSRLIYNLNLGTIPQEANYHVIGVEEGMHLGSLSEKFVERLEKHDVFALGGKTYEFIRAHGTHVYVKSAEGKRPTVPSWTGEMLPRSFDLSIEIGKFRAKVSKLLDKMEPSAIRNWLVRNYYLDDNCARSIVNYFIEQRECIRTIPTDKQLLIEGYIDGEGQKNLIFHYCFGRRVNDALSRAYAYVLSKKLRCTVRISLTDDNFMLTFPRQLELDGIDTYITSAELIPTLKRAIRHTELFKQRFRHCAARAFMILKNYKGREISIRKQHRRSRIVLDAVEHLEDFPVVDESYNEILHDAMDIDNALTVIKGIEKGAIKVSYAPYSHVPSPFAHNVVVVGMSDVILMEDRSALLRELHKQVLSRVFHPETIGEKPQFELRELEQYFMKKRIKVTTKNQILDVLAYFGGMQLFTTKGENIYRYTDCARTTVAGWCRELVDEGKVTSIARGSDVIWIRTDELPTYLTIYGYQGNLDELTDNETNVLELIRKRELPERRRGKSITETLKKLERKNIIYRKSISADNKINWAVRAFPAPTGLKLTDALDTIIIRHLKVYGPSTVQELGYDLAIDEDQIQNRLLELIDAKKVCSGYFALGKELPQYMLLEDIRELERKSKMRTADAVRKASPDKIIFTLDTLKQWSAMHDFTGFNTIDDYFDRYGFVVSLLELYNRLDNFELDTWLEQVRAGDIVLGRFVNGTLCYVRRKDMATYMNAYRVERLEPIDKLVLAVIEAVPGISKSDLIGLFCKKRTPAMSCAPAVLSQLADMPKLKSSYITKAIDKLEHNLYIVRVAEGTMQERGGVRYISTRIISEPKLSVRADAIKAILRKFMGAHAPISINMIEYHLGLSATTVKNYLRGLKRRGEIVECKLGSVSLLLTKELNSKLANAISTGSVAEKFVGDKVRILTLTDPYSRRYINEIRANFGDGNYLVILYGHQFIGMLELQDARESIDIFNMLLEPKIIDLEKPSALELNIFNNILKELDRIVTLYNELDGIEIIRLRSIAGVQIDQVHPKYVKLLRAFGYVKVQNYYVKGKIEPHVYELPDILAYVFHRQHIHPDSKFDTVLDAIKTLGGVKTDYEVLLRVKSKFYGLKSIARSYDLVAGTMIPHGYMYCTEEDWLIYHRAKNRKLDDAMRYVLSRMPENRPIAAQKLRDRVDMSKREFEHVWRKLCDGLFVVRESSNRYLKLDAYGNIDTYASDISSTAGTSIEVQEARYAVVKRLINNFGVISLDALYRFLHHDFKLDVIREILRALEADGKLVKGYFINGDDTLYWMTIDSINKIGKYKFHDYQFVLSPQDPLAIYLSDMLHAKFGIRSGYYVVFDGTDMLCAFKAKKEKDKFVLVELLRGETREEASRLNLKRILDIIYNFAYEHKLKLKFHDTLQLPELQELKEEMGYIYESDDYENVDIDYYEDIL